MANKRLPFNIIVDQLIIAGETIGLNKKQKQEFDTNYRETLRAWRARQKQNTEDDDDE